MKQILVIAIMMLAALLNGSALGQSTKRDAREDETCPGTAYTSKEVDQRAEITLRPEPEYTEKARTKKLDGRAVLTAVFCKTGRVTDIVVIEGLPFGMTEKVLKAARRIKFIPAEKDGQKVSQKIQIEYEFHLR